MAESSWCCSAQPAQTLRVSYRTRRFETGMDLGFRVFIFFKGSFLGPHEVYLKPV